LPVAFAHYKYMSAWKQMTPPPLKKPLYRAWMAAI